MQYKLLALRKKLNFTQKDMAKCLDVTVETYSNKENDVTDFKISEMYAIANMFQMNINPTDNLSLNSLLRRPL